MTQLQEYALIENGQIVRTEFFKRPSLVPSGDWRTISDVTPDFNSATHSLGGKTLQILEDETVAYIYTLNALPPPPPRQRVTNAALCMALSQINMLGLVESFIAQLPFDAPAVLLWKKATDFKRSDPLWEFFAPQLNMTSIDIDNLFNLAGQIDDVYGGEWN